MAVYTVVMMPPAAASSSTLPATMVELGPAAVDEPLESAEDCAVADELRELPDDALELAVDWLLAALDAAEPLLEAAEPAEAWPDEFEVPLAAELFADCPDELPVRADDAPAVADELPDWFDVWERLAHPASSASQASHLMD